MPPRDIPNEEVRIKEIIKGVVSFYSTRNLVVIVSLAFTFGGWATKVQLDLSSAQKQLAEDRVKSEERIQEWSVWRGQTTATALRHTWEIQNHEGRILNIEKYRETSGGPYGRKWEQPFKQDEEPDSPPANVKR